MAAVERLGKIGLFFGPSQAVYDRFELTLDRLRGNNENAVNLIYVADLNQSLIDLYCRPEDFHEV